MNKLVILICGISFFLQPHSVNANEGKSRKHADSLLDKVQISESHLEKAQIYARLIDDFVFLNRDSSRLFFDMALQHVALGKSKNSSKKDWKNLELAAGQALFNIGTVNYSASQFDSAMMHYKRAIVFQEKWKDKKRWAKTLNYMGRLNERKGNAQVYYNLTHQALELQKQVNDTNGISLSLIALADYYRAHNKPDSCELLYNAALDLLRQTSDPLRLSFCLHSQGAFLEDQGRYQDAIANYFEALGIQEQNQLLLGAMKNRIRISRLYSKLGEPEKALEFVSKAEELNQTVKNPTWQQSIYSRFAEIHIKKKNLSQGLAYYQKALEICNKWDLGPVVKSICLKSIGSIYRKLGDTEKSMNTLEKAHKIDLTDKAPYASTSLKYESGMTYLLVNKSKAKQYFKKSLEQAQIHNYPIIIRDASIELSVLSREEGNYKAAYEYYHIHSAAKDSINLDEAEKLLIRKDAEYRLKQKEQALLVQKQKTNILTQDKKIRNYALLAMSLGLLLISALSLAGYLHFTSRRKATLIKLQQNAEQINRLQNDVQKLLNEESINPNTLVIEESINQYLETPLSSRELDVLRQLSKGKSNQEIGEVLFVSINTVRSHLQKIYDKLDVKNRTQAVRKIGEIHVIHS